MDNQNNPNPQINKDFFARVDPGATTLKTETETVEKEEVNPAEKTVNQPAPYPPVGFPPPPSPAADGSPLPRPLQPSGISDATFKQPAGNLTPDYSEGEGRNLKKPVLLIGAVFLILGAAFLLVNKLLPKLKIGKEVSLNYWGLWEPTTIMDGIITDYQKKHPKIKINYLQQSPKEYRERLQTAIAEGNGPDIFRFHNTWLPMFKNDLSAVPASVMDAATFEKIYYPVVRNDLRFGNSYLGIPLYMDNLALFYNEEIFETAGKKPPTTWDEFAKTAVDLTVKDASGKIQTSGAAIGITSNIDHWSDILGLMLLQNDVNLANPTGNLAEDVFSYYTAFYNEQRIWDETLPSSTYYFASGRLAMYFAPSWRIFEIKALNPSLKFKVIPTPGFPGVDISWATYWVEGVSKKSPNQAEAWEFLQYLSTKEVMEKLYQNQSKERLFGEPYSRVDMADLLKNEPLVGVFINQAPKAKSWYLCSRTFDNGINDRIIKYFEDAVNAVNQGRDVKGSLMTVAQGVSQVLSQYGMK